MRRLDYIAHHGILGMKWGIRRTPAQLGHHTPKPRKLASGKTGDYKNDGQTVKQTYGKGKTRLIQSRNDSPYAGKSKLVQIAEYHDKKVAAKERAKAKIAKQKAVVKEANRTEKQRRKALGKEGRLKEDYQKKKGMSEEEASTAAAKKMKRDKYVKIGIAAGATALTAYGAYKIHKEGIDGIAKKGGNIVGKILGAKEYGVEKARTAKSEYRAAKAVAKQKAKLRDVLPDRERTVNKAFDKYSNHPEMAQSISEWMTRDNSFSPRFGNKGNSLSDLEEYLSRVYPTIVKRS